MNGAHDLGGMMGFGPIAAPRIRTGVSRKMGRPHGRPLDDGSRRLVH